MGRFASSAHPSPRRIASEQERGEQGGRGRRYGPARRLGRSVLSEEQRTEEAALAVGRYMENPLTSTRKVVDATAAARERAWELWIDRMKKRQMMRTDAESLWLDLRRGLSWAKALCQGFLRDYVTSSVREFPVLGSEGDEWRRTVNSASTVIEQWRRLVARVDATVMERKRKATLENPEFWTLTFDVKNNARKGASGPVHEIAEWIRTDLAKELQLVTEPTYEKVEATVEDIRILIQTIYDRAESIPATPESRVSFHAMVLIMALCGCRPGVVCSIPYRQIRLAVVRDPEHLTRKKIIATIFFQRNKKKMAVASGDNIYGFSFTFIPSRILCLLSLVVSRAIQQDAFLSEYRTIQDLLRLPDLENVDYVPLRWKESMLGESIFPATYSTFSVIWHRTFVVAGFRNIPRIYSLRVGAGMRLDGKLTPALRNFIMSHTSRTFEQSYQTRAVRENLMNLAFGPDAGSSGQLFDHLRHLALTRDPNAPINVTPGEHQEIEQRRDITDRRVQIKAERDDQARKSLRNELTGRLRCLSDRKLMEKRADYFRAADNVRANPSTKSPAAPASPRCPTPRHSRQNLFARKAARIGCFLQSCAKEDQKGEPDKLYSEGYLERLVEYLSCRSAISTPIDDQASDKCGPKGDWTCLLAEDCGSFCHRQALTNHVLGIHRRTLARSFACPECARLGAGEIWIDNGPHWSAHVETVHGKKYAPNIPSKPRPARDQVRCSLCNAPYTRVGLQRHVRLAHDQRDGMFKKPFPCPECGALIDGLSAWLGHVSSVHSKADEIGLAPMRKRMRVDEPETVARGKRQRMTVPQTIADSSLAGVTTDAAVIIKTEETEIDLLLKTDPV